MYIYIWDIYIYIYDIYIYMSICVYIMYYYIINSRLQKTDQCCSVIWRPSSPGPIEETLSWSSLCFYVVGIVFSTTTIWKRMGLSENGIPSGKRLHTVAIEHGHRNSGFSHKKWWIFPVRYVTVYQRVPYDTCWWIIIFTILMSVEALFLPCAGASSKGRLRRRASEALKEIPPISRISSMVPRIARITLW